MDGRVQLPVLHWIRRKHHIDYIDVITEPGMDGVLATQDNIKEFLRRIRISIEINNSVRIFIVGHHDCRGNPVDKKAHRKNILKAVKRLKSHWPGLDIIGLWVNNLWQVEVCCK
jgi:hypothetical protein